MNFFLLTEYVFVCIITQLSNIILILYVYNFTRNITKLYLSDNNCYVIITHYFILREYLIK